MSDQINARPQCNPQVTEDLRAAIKNLEAFAQLNTTSAFPHFHNLDVKQGQIVPNTSSPINKVVDLARCFITAMLSDEVRRQYKEKSDLVQQELLRSIKVVKSNYLLIDRLKQGDDGQRRLAATALSAIDRYNRVMGEAAETPSTLGLRFARFMFQKTGMTISDKLKGKTIDLPAPIALQYQSPMPADFSHKVSQGLPSAASRKLSSIVTAVAGSTLPACLPTRSEVDAFRVKAFAMIRSYGMRAASLNEALQAVHHSPIQTTIEEDPESTTIITIRQTIQPFPGEEIVLQGSFERDAHQRVASIPLPNSFRLYSKSSQTGFPFPLQHNGWALCEKLIPHFPHALDQMPLFQDLFQRKKQVASDLLPRGHLVQRAKQSIEVRRLAFQNQLSTFLDLHQQLTKKIIVAATGQLGKSEEEVVDAAFANLATLPDVYNQLCGLWHFINERFVMRPHEKLQDEWLGHGHAGLLSLDQEERYRASWGIFLNEIDVAKTNVIRGKNLPHNLQAPEIISLATLVGPLTANASCALILQSLSEKIEFPPPALSRFEEQLQMALYKQLNEFLNGLQNETPVTEEAMLASLQSDIACFDDRGSLSSALEHPRLIVSELKRYFR